MEIPKIFRYEQPKFPSDCRYKISPSLLHMFYDNPAEWCRTTFLGKGDSFKGNTRTVLGTICHYIYYCVAKGIKPSVFDINDQLEKYNAMCPELELDVSDIFCVYQGIVEEVVNKYIMRQPKTDNAELKMIAKLYDGIYAGGTVDRIDGDCIVDFKTVWKKPQLDCIPLNYKYQLLTYAKIAQANGFDIKRIRIVYGVKPQKTIGARCYDVTEEITYDNQQLIDKTLELACESLKLVEEHPDIGHIIFRDTSLKEEISENSKGSTK